MEKFKPAATPEKKARSASVIKGRLTKLKNEILELNRSAGVPAEGFARIKGKADVVKEPYDRHEEIGGTIEEKEREIYALEEELREVLRKEGSKKATAEIFGKEESGRFDAVGEAYDQLYAEKEGGQAEKENVLAGNVSAEPVKDKPNEAALSDQTAGLEHIRQYDPYEGKVTVEQKEWTGRHAKPSPESQKVEPLELTDRVDGGVNVAHEARRLTPEELEGVGKRIEAAETATPTPEKLKQKVAEMGERKQEIVADAEKRGSWIGRKVRGVGEWYKKQPLWKKAAFTVAVAGGGLWGGGVLAGAAGVAMFGKRVAVGASAFVAIEAALRKSKEKKERFWNKHPSEYAAILALLIASGLPQAAEAFVGDDEVRGVIQDEAQKPIDTIVTKDTLEEVKPGASVELPGPTESDLIHQDRVASELPGATESDLIHADKSTAHVYEDYGNSDPRQDVPPESVGIDDDYGNSDPRMEDAAPEAAPTVIETSVKSGDNLWKIIEHDPRLAESLKGLSPEQRVYVIDAMKDQFAKMDPSQLRELGIGSGNIDKLAVGETLNLGSVLDNKSFLEEAHKGALKLSPEQLANIKRNIS